MYNVIHKSPYQMRHTKHPNIETHSLTQPSSTNDE